MSLTPLDVVQGRWGPGDLGFYDRVSVTRYLIMKAGGLGKVNETRATVQKRAENLERVFINWSRENPNDFSSYGFCDSEDGSLIRQARMHYEMQQSFHGQRNTAIEAYRGSGKTGQLESAIIWRLGHDQETLIKLVSEGGDTASQRIRNVRNHIESNPLLHMVFPGLVPQPKMPWSDEQITVRRNLISRDPSLGGWGITAKGVGGRCNLLCGDDVIPPKSISSLKTREEATRMWQEVWTKQLFRSGQVWFVFTPWHELDLGHKIRDNAEYRHLYYPVGGPSGCKACPDNDGRPCDIPFHNPWAAHLWSSEALARVYRRDGSLSYSRSHMLLPLASEMSLFPDALFEGRVRRPDLIMGRGWRWWATHGVRRVFGVDLALGGGTGHDYFVIFVLGFDELGYRYVVDIKRTRTMGYQAQLELMSQMYSKHRPELIFIEGTQYQRVFSDTLAATTALPVRPFYPLGAGKGRRVEGADKRDLKFGVPGLRILFENYKYYIPTGNEHSQEHAELFIDELKHFAMTEEGKVEGSGAHDDIVMAGWIAEQAAMKLGASLYDQAADPDLTGIEDWDLRDVDAGSSLHKAPRFGDIMLPLLAEGAGLKTQIQVPEHLVKRPGIEDYEAIMERLHTIPDATLKAYDVMVDAMRQAPTTKQMIQGGFRAGAAGTLTGLMQRYGLQEMRFVLHDLTTSHRVASTAIDQKMLFEMDEEAVEDLFGEDYDLGGIGIPSEEALSFLRGGGLDIV